MIKKLCIKNFVLIDELEIDFDKGLNILTGETGSGKSIIIDAIDLAFGARASKSQIKTGTDKAYIELYVNTDNSFPREILENNGIETDEANNEKNILIISREITNTSTKSRINGVLVTQSYVQSLRRYLLDIHTQHESYNYIYPGTHVELLDNYAHEKYAVLLKNYRETFNEFKNTEKELEQLQLLAVENERETDFLKFQIQEIKNAEIDNINEYDELMNERIVLLNAVELKEITFSSYSLLYENEQSITDILNLIENKLVKAAEFDKKLLDTAEIISSSAINLKEYAKELRNYSENLEINPQKLNQTEERIEILEKMKKKYGPKLSDVLNNLEKFESELNEINFSDKKIVQLAETVKDLEEKTKNLAKELSASRKEVSVVLSGLIQGELVNLEMPKVKFCVSVETGEELTLNGCDNVEFLISPNIGEPLKPIAKIASGGEISRIMLAIKSIFARSDRVNTV
ncbi:MAG: DNA repair protein RecN, partial [Candidatus Aenigmarchaeota archaeon]|nr:DNA repair protein RecN [Candidatus Aenigmarchaeota archaeon]